MNSDRAIMSVRGLRKRFGAIEAVIGLDFTVPRGCVCGFLGRNGAGKTTTIKMLLGMTHADGGEGHIFDEPIGAETASVRIRQRTGFVGEVKEFYPFMTVRQMIGTRSGRWTVDCHGRRLRRACQESPRCKSDGRGDQKHRGMAAVVAPAGQSQAGLNRSCKMDR